MANSFTSAQTQKVADKIMDDFEGNAVLVKEVDTQLLNEGGIDMPEYGGSISFQRPMQWRTVETSDGDVSAQTKNDVIYGKSTGTVQNVVTVELDYNAVDQAIRARQLDRHLDGIGQYLLAKVEQNFSTFMINNSGLTIGTVGTFVDSWDDIMATKAFFRSMGVKGEIKNVVNDYSMGKLASLQQGVSNMPSNNVRSAWEDAQIPSRVAGVSVMSSDMLSNYQSGATTARSGTLAATPTATYASVKDSMTQTLSLTGLTASVTNAVRAGDVLEFTGTGANARSYVNGVTKQPFYDASGAPLKWRATVLTGGNTDGSGNVTVTVSTPAIYESNGQYNNISAALTSGDAFTILGALNTTYKPNIAFASGSFGIGFVDLPKLNSTDTVIRTEQGISMRVSRGVDFRGNKQLMRVDVLPAFICFNPMRSARSWG